jgi:streptogramin lyase
MSQWGRDVCVSSCLAESRRHRLSAILLVTVLALLGAGAGSSAAAAGARATLRGRASLRLRREQQLLPTLVAGLRARRAGIDDVSLAPRLAQESFGARFAAQLTHVQGDSSAGPVPGPLSLSANPLVIPGVQLLDGDEQLSEQLHAEQTGAPAVERRARSQSEFESLSGTKSASVLAHAFPDIVGQVAPVTALPGGERVTGYLSDRAATTSSGGGQPGLIEAMRPIAVKLHKGDFAPVELALRPTGASFEPALSPVRVSIPRRLGDGIAMPGLGIDLTPVSAGGAALHGSEGTQDGDVVFYANTQADTDSLVKPTSTGFDVGTVLRSVRSPSRLYFRLTLPAGLHASAVAGGIEIAGHGAAVAVVPNPTARDATGRLVPTTLSLVGKTLVMSVADGAGMYQFPIEVDPEVNDSQLTETSGRRSNWEFHASSSHFTGTANTSAATLTTSGSSHSASEFGYWGYQTKGVSHIWEISSESEAHNVGAGIESFLELEAPPSGSQESKQVLSAEASGTGEYARKADPVLCASGGCVPSSGTAGNAVHFQQSATKAVEGKSFSDTLYQGVVSLAEPAGTHSATSYNTTSKEIEFEVEPEPGKKEKQRRVNALAVPGTWLSGFQGALELVATDPGIGVSATRLEYESSPGVWEEITEHNYLEHENACQGVQCYPEHREAWTLSPRVPNGEDKIRYTAHDAMPGTESLTSEGIATVKVDHSPPHDLVIHGLPLSDEIREAPYEITAEATDGESPTVASSGIRSISLFVDGKEVGKPAGACSVPKGECRGAAKFTINGAELGAGTATIVMVATDNAGNEARHGELVTVSHSKPIQLGPGSLDLESGDFTLGATDVSMGSGLTVSRVYSSRDVTAGEKGSLGPQWSVSLGTTESLHELAEGSVDLTSANGSEALFLYLGPGKGYEAPLGDANLKLTVEENEQKTAKLAYYLTDSASHTTVKFTRSTSGSSIWVPTKQEGQVATDTVTYRYQTVQQTGGATVTRPLEALAPVPSGVSCSWKEKPTEMQSGCRALIFKYAEATTATGEAESEWGEYNQRLMRVSMVAFNPQSRAMQEIPVAEYAYDSRGRLRAEWDPRVSPALKTIYGYDGEGHVTALDPPGQEPWVFTYGTTSVDAGSGRLLKLDRAQPLQNVSQAEERAHLAEQKLSSTNLEAPQITGSPLVGVKLALSTGKWTHQPTAYGFRWELCSNAGTECLPIPGADSANYIVQPADADHKLHAVVTALTGAGASSASAPTTALVGEPATQFTMPTGTGQAGAGIVEGPDGNFWVTRERTIDRVTPHGEITQFSLPAKHAAGQIISGPEGALWFTEEAKGESSNVPIECLVGKITTSGQITEHSIPNSSGEFCGEALTAGREGDLWTVARRHALLRMATNGAITGEWQLPEHRLTTHLTTGPEGDIWFTSDPYGGPETSAIGRATTSGSITEWTLPSGANPAEITTGPDGNLWFDEPYGNGGTKHAIGKITPTGAISEYFLSANSFPQTIAAGEDGRVWFTNGNLEGDNVADSLGAITVAGQVSEYKLPKPESEEGFLDQVAAGSSDGDIWYATDRYAGRIPASGLTAATEGEAQTPQPGTTIEYGVPLSGTGLPTMSGEEVARWGQTDVPVEASAVIPADSPQGWPASSYTRANIYYIDEHGRIVNTSAPSEAKHGEISTSEYNESNDVIRELTPGNRTNALEEGSERTPSARLAELHSTEYTYNGEGAKEFEVTEPGTRLIEKLGPQHEVKYIAGKEHKESLARNHERFFYDEGAPTAKTHETYELMTKVSDEAQLANEEEVEVRTTHTGYSGQESTFAPGGIGWKLRAPTSSTIESASGSTITTTSLYNELGQITETRAPEGASGNSPRDEQTIYYTSTANSEAAQCGGHPEWSGLVCETRPAKQPESTVAPKLPIKEYTYNIWNEPVTTTETFGAAKRVMTRTYDQSGRLTKGATTATGSNDPTLPAVSDEYSEFTGALIVQSQTSEKGTVRLESTYNTLGQRLTYSDGDGNTATYRYAGVSNDNLLEEVTDGSDGGKGKQTYSYEPVTKRLTSLTDSSAGTFKASYDAEGQLTDEVYPDGLCAKYAYNPAGEAVGLEYAKTSNCSEATAPVWFSESRIASIHGETVNRNSTLASEEYTYDGFGRLTEARETPAGEGCNERLYEYDEESNRTAETVRKPSKLACATKGGTVLSHTYDEANQLIDTGVTYEEFGNVTELPSADTEKEPIATTYYLDNAVATQEQEKVLSSFELDPEGRVRLTTKTKKGKTLAQFVSHYDAPGAAVAWTSEGEKWTRNIPGIGGSLAATQTSGQEVVLQLPDLEGDIVATASESAEATGPSSTYDPTEFGVPNGGKTPPKFSWLGASAVASESSTGLITEGATSYDPQTGRALQSEEVEPPGVPYGSGAGAPYTFVEEPWNLQGAGREASEAPGLEAGREQEAAEAACRANVAACPGYGDPIHNILLVTPLKSIEWGQVLCNCSVVHGISVVIEAILGQIGVEGVGSVVEEILEGGEGEQIGKELLTCGEAVKSNPLNRCALQLHTASLFGVDTYIPTGLNVGACYYYKKSYKGLKAKRLHCPNGAEYKPPY